MSLGVNRMKVKLVPQILPKISKIKKKGYIYNNNLTNLGIIQVIKP